MGIGAVALLLFYSLQYMVALCLAPNYWWALLVLLVSILTGMVCLWLSPFRKKTMGMYRFLKLRSAQPEVINRLSEQRRHIINQFEELI